MVKEICQFSSKGLVRENNEDKIALFNFQHQGEEWVCLAVADGVGGHNSGEYASEMAMTELEKSLQSLETEDEPHEFLGQILNRINEKVFHASQSAPEYEGMGTTLTVALIRDLDLYIAHVGDSRAYLYVGDKMIRLTEDHSIVGAMVQSGKITVEEARTHPRKNLILRAIGFEKDVNIDYFYHKLLPNDWIILMTDGLSDLLSEEKMEKVLIEEKENFMTVFNSLVMELGAKDNFSLVAVAVGGESSHEFNQ